MNHDPLCRAAQMIDGKCIQCDLIARVRKDERSNYWECERCGLQMHLSHMIDNGPDHKGDPGYVCPECDNTIRAAALRDAVEAVLSMTPAAYLHIPKVGEQTLILLGDAVAAIEALGGEQ